MRSLPSGPIQSATTRLAITIEKAPGTIAFAMPIFLASSSLVKRLAASGLTVLLSSHHMDEVEGICDNVTIMNRGTVAFHGTIDDLRAMAPDPGHLLRTGDDAQAVSIGQARHPAVDVEPSPEGGLVATGSERDLAAYVADLVRAEVPLLAFTPTRTPLEALFFMLTDARSDDVRRPREKEAVR